MSINRRLALLCLCSLSLLTPAARADDLRSAMEADNARWLKAFNQPDPAAFVGMYTPDALLLPPGTQPVTGGPQAIRDFWESRIKLGVKEHTFEIVSTEQDGRQAWQVARWTAVLVKDTGERVPLSGNTVRLFERQSDGRWLTKVHIFNRHQ